MGHRSRPTAQGSGRTSPNRPAPKALPAVSIWRCESPWQAPPARSGIFRRRFVRPHRTRLAGRTAATERGRTLGTDPVACDVFDFGALGEPDAEHRPRLAVLRGQVGNAVNHDVHRSASANAPPGLPGPTKPPCQVAHRGRRWMRDNLPVPGAEPPEPALLGAEPMLLDVGAHSRAPTEGDPGPSTSALREATSLIHARMAPPPSGPG